jgi:hypothetical protein
MRKKETYKKKGVSRKRRNSRKRSKQKYPMKGGDVVDDIKTENKMLLAANMQPISDGVYEAVLKQRTDLSNVKQELGDLQQDNEDKRQYIEELEHRVKELEDQKAVLLEDAPPASASATDELLVAEHGDVGLGAPADVASGAAPAEGGTTADELAALKARFAALQAANGELTAEVRDLRDANTSEQTARLEAEKSAKLKVQQATNADEEKARLLAQNLKLTEALADNAQVPQRLQNLQAELEETRVALESASQREAEAERQADIADEDGPSLFDDLEVQDQAQTPPMKDVGDNVKGQQIADLEAEVKKLNDQLNLPCKQLENYKAMERGFRHSGVV